MFLRIDEHTLIDWSDVLIRAGGAGQTKNLVIYGQSLVNSVF